MIRPEPSIFPNNNNLKAPDEKKAKFFIGKPSDKSRVLL